MNTGYKCLRCGCKRVDAKLIKFSGNMEVEIKCFKCDNNASSDVAFFSDEFQYEEIAYDNQHTDDKKRSE